MWIELLYRNAFQEMMVCTYNISASHIDGKILLLSVWNSFTVMEENIRQACHNKIIYDLPFKLRTHYEHIYT